MPSATSIIATALADINADDLVGVASVTEIPNSGLGGTGFDYDTVIGTPANGKPHPPGSVVFFGASGDFASTPDAPNNRFSTMDPDIRIRLNPDSWATQIDFNGKEASVNNRQFAIRVNVTTKTIGFFWWPTGASASEAAAISTIGVPFSSGLGWLRITVDRDNGAGDADFTFYTSTDDTDDDSAVSWTQLGNVVHPGSTVTFFDSTTTLKVGRAINATMDGNVRRYIIRSTINGTVVVDMSPADQPDASDLTWTSLSTGEVWTLNSNTFVQNTGHKALDSIGSYGLETTAGQDIAVFTRFVVGRFTTAAPGADQVIFDARSNALKSVSLFSDFSNSNKLTLDAGGTPIAIAGVYDTDLHVFTVVSNGANSLLRVSGVGEITGNPGSEVLDYGTILANLGSGSSAPFSYLRDLTFNSALNKTQIGAVERHLFSKYRI